MSTMFTAIKLCTALSCSMYFSTVIANEAA